MSCLDEDRLRALGTSGLDDDTRRHVEGCAQCQAVLAPFDSGSTVRRAGDPGFDSARTAPRVTPFTASFDSQRTDARHGPADGVLTDGSTVGSYVVRARLGSGAMGAVYAAWDPRLEREVALKVLHLDGDLLTEARALAKLSHPNVVAVHEVFSWDGRAVLVMERVHGQTLRAWLATSPSVSERLRVLRQCAEGLAAAHDAGIVHRDFKPDNVLVDATGRARLLDFGLALHNRTGGSLAGSPAYLPLQQLEGAPANAGSDQFAWWATVYEAFEGRVPHDAPSLPELREVRRTGPVTLKATPLWLRPAVLRGLSNDPARRWPSMRDAVAAATPPRRLALGLAVAALVFAGVIAAWAWSAPSPCNELEVKPDALLARATSAGLADSARAYAESQQRCLALAPAEQPARAACLATVGRELDVALDALEGVSDLPPGFAGRVLKRVRPVSACERPTPLSAAPIEPDRVAVIESLRTQLRFDALRQTGKFEDAATLAVAHARATSAASPMVRAWAGVNEASARSTSGDSAGALERLRQLEGLEGLALREHAWVSVGRWMFECYASSEQHCDVAERQARRVVTQLDEPWANAFALEVAALFSEEPVSGQQLVEGWKRLPGATYELQRAITNELGVALGSDDLPRRRAALAVARQEPAVDARGRLARLNLELQDALQAGDFARAAAQVRAIDALPPDTAGVSLAQFEARWSVLLSRGDGEGVLKLLETADEDETQRVRRLGMELIALTLLGSPRAKEKATQLELLVSTLPERELGFIEWALTTWALRVGDAAMLVRVPVAEGYDLERAWHLALLKQDAAAERQVYDDARAAGGDLGGWLSLEARVVDGAFMELARDAHALRAAVVLDGAAQQLRLLEAWALWNAGQRDDACRLVTTRTAALALTARQRERFDVLRRGCPSLGLSAWPD